MTDFWLKQKWRLECGGECHPGQFNLHGQTACFCSIRQTFPGDANNAPAALRHLVDIHNALLEFDATPEELKALHVGRAMGVLRTLFELSGGEQGGFIGFVEAQLNLYRAAGKID